MSTLAKRDENGELGESLTQSILLSRFWVLKRSADVDGADFLVQRQCDSQEELRTRAREIEMLGIVQSKYFEFSNRVSVQAAYVLDGGKPRKEFFCSLHTLDAGGEHVHYFFSATEVHKEFELSTCGKFYWFAITKERKYINYRNPKRNLVLDKIESGMNEAEGNANKDFLRNRFRMYARPTMYFDKVANFQYSLSILDDVRVAIVKDMDTNSKRSLEARRDFYENQGDFYWGDDDIGCQFLAVSILAHHFNGDLPDDAPVAALRDLLQGLDVNSPHVIDSQALRDLVTNTVEGPNNTLRKLESEFPMELSGHYIAFFEVISILDTVLTVRCSNGIESVVDTGGCSSEIVHKLEGVKILMRGSELNAEPIRKTVAIRLSVERDAETSKVARILDAFDIHKVH